MGFWRWAATNPARSDLDLLRVVDERMSVATKRDVAAILPCYHESWLAATKPTAVTTALRATTEDEKGSSLPDRSRPYSAIGCPLGAQS